MVQVFETRAFRENDVDAELDIKIKALTDSDQYISFDENLFPELKISNDEVLERFKELCSLSERLGLDTIFVHNQLDIKIILSDCSLIEKYHVISGFLECVSIFDFTKVNTSRSELLIDTYLMNLEELNLEIADTRNMDLKSYYELYKHTEFLETIGKKWLPDDSSFFVRLAGYRADLLVASKQYEQAVPEYRALFDLSLNSRCYWHEEIPYKSLHSFFTNYCNLLNKINRENEALIFGQELVTELTKNPFISRSVLAYTKYIIAQEHFKYSHFEVAKSLARESLMTYAAEENERGKKVVLHLLKKINQERFESD